MKSNEIFQTQYEKDVEAWERKYGKKRIRKKKVSLPKWLTKKARY